MVNANVSILKQLTDTVRYVSENHQLKKRFLFSPTSFSRDRKLNFSTVSFLILSLLKKSLNVELRHFFDTNKQSVLTPCTKSAFCQQRKKIDSSWFRFLLEYTAQLFYEQTKTVKRWHGYKIISVDSSAAFLVSTPAMKNFYQGAQNQFGGYALGRYMKMYDVLNGITLKTELMPFNGSERYMSYKWVDTMHADAVTLFDRGFPAFTLFYLMQNSEIPKPYVMRCKKQFNHLVRNFVNNNCDDEILTFYPDDRAIQTLLQYGFKITRHTAVKVRAVKMKMADGSAEILLTNFFDKTRLTINEIAELYRMRWKIETDIGKEKNLFQLENFSSHTRNSIEQDFYATFVAANIHQIISRQADESVKQKTAGRKYEYKINTSASLSVFKANLVRLYYSTSLKKLLLHLQTLFELYVEPIRPERQMPRVRRTKKRYGKHQTQTNYRNNL
jgi:hypothetical protein